MASRDFPLHFPPVIDGPDSRRAQERRRVKARGRRRNARRAYRTRNPRTK